MEVDMNRVRPVSWFVVCVFAAVLFCVIPPRTFAQTVTLVPPEDPATKKYYEGRSCYSFKYGALKESVLKQTKTNDFDLAYGFMAINDEDWFKVKTFEEKRNVIQDLGEIDWNNLTTIPVLEPLPEVPEGGHREITVDSSGDTHKAWAKSTKVFAKVFLNHVYEVHVKDKTADFYVLFKVVEFEQRRHCTITWRLVRSPEENKAP
jgi:hypothetical protein